MPSPYHIFMDLWFDDTGFSLGMLFIYLIQDICYGSKPVVVGIPKRSVLRFHQVPAKLPFALT